MATEYRSMKYALTILWRIENIHIWESHRKKIAVSVLSPDFTPRLLYGYRFRLVLSQSHGSSHEEKGLHLFCLDDAFDVPIECEVAVIAQDGSHFFNDVVKSNFVKKSGMNIVFFSVMNNEVFQNQRSSFLSQNCLTLQFRIWKSNEDFLETEHFSLRSRLVLLHNSLLWCIPGITTLKLNEEVTSPVRFKLANTPNDFLMTFSFQGASLKRATGYVKFLAESIAHKPPILSWKVTIMTRKGKLETVFDMRPCPQIGKIPFIGTIGKREGLLRYSYYYFKDDILRLVYEMGFYYTTVSIEKSLYGCPNPIADVYLDTSSVQTGIDPIDTVSRGRESIADIHNLYADKNATDFEIRLGKVSFLVHKVVLNARSVFFRNMFSSDVNQFKTNSMEIGNLDMHTLSQMLNFLYKGFVDCLMGENAVRLYHAANLYQVQSLQRECRSFFISTINVKNVSDILLMADEHKDDELKLSAYYTISRNFSEVINSPQWAEFMEHKPELAVKSMHQSYLRQIQDNNDTK